MTVLFAFTSAQNKMGFICGDDLEANNKRRVDKVVQCWERFAIGVYGVDVLKTAVSLAAYFDQHSTRVLNGNRVVVPGPTSVHSLCNAIAACLPRLVAHELKVLQAAVNQQRMSPQQQQAWLTMYGGLAILDHQTLQLYEAKPQQPIAQAVQSPPTFIVSTLTDGHGWRFGVNGTTDLGQLQPQALTAPGTWAQSELGQAVALCHAHGQPGVLGNLGTMFTKDLHGTTYQSVHSTFDDILNALGYA